MSLVLLEQFSKKVRSLISIIFDFMLALLLISFFFSFCRANMFIFLMQVEKYLKENTYEIGTKIYIFSFIFSFFSLFFSFFSFRPTSCLSEVLN